MTISKEYLEKSKIKLPIISFVIALIGSTLSMWGASWDITSHLLRIPETFFTASHGILYLGVGICLISAVLGLVLFLSKKEIREKSFGLGIKLIIFGAVLQIIAGPGDFFWHELFGIDGLLSPTHITLALGIMIVTIGAVIGFARIHFHLTEKSKFLVYILPTSFGILWFSVMWFVFFFVLPISDGDTHNFNPNPNVAIILSFIFIPFVFSLVFWSAFKTLRRFGAASMAMFVFVIMNITSNILTSENLFFYLPWFIIPIISTIIAEYVLSNKNNSKVLQKYSDKISGAILGSMFFMFCFPMLAMTFLEPYLFNDVFSYDVLPNSAETISQIWMMTIIPGAISGVFGMVFASKWLKFQS